MINAQNAATLRELRPLLAEPTGELVPPRRVSLKASRVAGCIGLVCGILFAFAVDETAARLLTLQAFSSDALLSVIVLPLAFWLFSRAAYFTIFGMQSVTAIVERHLSIDLLDSSRLTPLGQMALRAALLWIGAAVVTSLSVLPVGPRGLLVRSTSGAPSKPGSGATRRLASCRAGPTSGEGQPSASRRPSAASPPRLQDPEHRTG